MAETKLNRFEYRPAMHYWCYVRFTNYHLWHVLGYVLRAPFYKLLTVSGITPRNLWTVSAKLIPLTDGETKLDKNVRSITQFSQRQFKLNGLFLISLQDMHSKKKRGELWKYLNHLTIKHLVRHFSSIIRNQNFCKSHIAVQHRLESQYILLSIESLGIRLGGPL